jgi:hypothetical protein
MAAQRCNGGACGLQPVVGTRRSHETAALFGALLPERAHRQWTLSAPVPG